jgi:transposase
VPTLIDVVDAVVEINRHRDTYEVELASPTGTPIATVSVSKDSAGYSDLLSWLVTHAPGPRLALSGPVAGRYAAGLARAVTAAGMVVIEPDEPDHIPERDQEPKPIEVHKAASKAWQLDAGRLLSLQTEGDQDALRILLCARRDLTTTATRHGIRLRALLLSGHNSDRKIARATFTEATLVSLARRPQPHDGSRQRSVRHAEIRRLAHSLITIGRDLKTNATQIRAIVDDLVPGLTDQRGVGPINAAQAIVNLSHPVAVPEQRRPPATEETSSLQQQCPPAFGAASTGVP